MENKVNKLDWVRECRQRNVTLTRDRALDVHFICRMSRRLCIFRRDGCGAWKEGEVKRQTKSFLWGGDSQGESKALKFEILSNEISLRLVGTITPTSADDSRRRSAQLIDWIECQGFVWVSREQKSSPSRFRWSKLSKSDCDYIIVSVSSHFSALKANVKAKFQHQQRRLHDDGSFFHLNSSLASHRVKFTCCWSEWRGKDVNPELVASRLWLFSCRCFRMQK